MCITTMNINEEKFAIDQFNLPTVDEVLILGIGHNTVTVMDLVDDCGYKIKGLLHYNHDRIGERYFGVEIVGCFEDYLSYPTLKGIKFVLSMGNLSIRRRIYNQIISKNGVVPSLIHPSCEISKRAVIGNGVQIMPNSIVQGDSSIGSNTVITVNSVIAHSSHIGAHCLISGNVMVGAYCNIGNNTHIGQGSTVVSGKVNNIGHQCILGAGSVLISDMPDNTVFVGNPAHYIKDNSCS